jgi:hypothetical protein
MREWTCEFMDERIMIRDRQCLFNMRAARILISAPGASLGVEPGCGTAPDVNSRPKKDGAPC